MSLFGRLLHGLTSPVSDVDLFRAKTHFDNAKRWAVAGRLRVSKDHYCRGAQRLLEDAEIEYGRGNALVKNYATPPRAIDNAAAAAASEIDALMRMIEEDCP